MGLFSSDKKKKTAKKAAPAAKKVAARPDVLTAPWMSEKALIGTEKGIYVFAIPPRATKTEVAAAIEAVYNVKPAQVRVANLPGKRKALRHKRGFGTRAARRKAYVYLKKGDTLTIA